MNDSPPHAGPYDQRLARLLIRPFAGTPLHPNHVTTVSLLLGIASGAVFAVGGPDLAWLGALLFVLAVLVDHMDGELARMTGKTSRFGHYYDYVVGSLNYTVLFAGLGWGLSETELGATALWVGLAAGFSNPVIVSLRRASERVRFRTRGFHLSDRADHLVRRIGLFLLGLRLGDDRLSDLDDPGAGAPRVAAWLVSIR